MTDPIRYERPERPTARYGEPVSQQELDAIEARRGAIARVRAQRPTKTELDALYAELDQRFQHHMEDERS